MLTWWRTHVIAPIHAVRIPLPAPARKAMGLVYVFAPVVAGYYVMEWTNAKRDANIGKDGQVSAFWSSLPLSFPLFFFLSSRSFLVPFWFLSGSVLSLSFLFFSILSFFFLFLFPFSFPFLFLPFPFSFFSCLSLWRFMEKKSGGSLGWGDVAVVVVTLRLKARIFIHSPISISISPATAAREGQHRQRCRQDAHAPPEPAARRDAPQPPAEPVVVPALLPFRHFLGVFRAIPCVRFQVAFRSCSVAFGYNIPAVEYLRGVVF